MWNKPMYHYYNISDGVSLSRASLLGPAVVRVQSLYGPTTVNMQSSAESISTRNLFVTSECSHECHILY